MIKHLTIYLSCVDSTQPSPVSNCGLNKSQLMFIHGRIGCINISIGMFYLGSRSYFLIFPGRHCFIIICNSLNQLHFCSGWMILRFYKPENSTGTAAVACVCSNNRAVRGSFTSYCYRCTTTFSSVFHIRFLFCLAE